MSALAAVMHVYMVKSIVALLCRERTTENNEAPRRTPRRQVRAGLRSPVAGLGNPPQSRLERDACVLNSSVHDHVRVQLTSNIRVHCRVVESRLPARLKTHSNKRRRQGGRRQNSSAVHLQRANWSRARLHVGVAGRVGWQVGSACDDFEWCQGAQSQHLESHHGAERQGLQKREWNGEGEKKDLHERKHGGDLVRFPSSAAVGFTEEAPLKTSQTCTI
eukprot:2246527-Rhodomonas_salina.1